MTALATLAFTVALLFAAPVLANHDSGQSRSQDHLHGKNTVAGGGFTPLQVVAIPQPSSLLLFGLGVITVGVAARYRRSALGSR